MVSNYEVAIELGKGKDIAEEKKTIGLAHPDKETMPGIFNQ